MGSNKRRIVVEFLGDDKSLSATSNKVAGSTSAIGGKLKKFGAIAATGFAVAGAAAVKFGIDAIGSASDLNETLSKSRVIFGKQAPAMEKWAAGAARSTGLSKQAALESAASFGDMFSQIGFAGDEAAKMSKGVVQLSADLGSFNNLPTAEVSDMMSAAFRGEYDSLQRVIPNINAARVEQEALAMTHKKSAKELTASEKAAATLAIVQRDGARATGDFARTSDGLANQQKILSAQFENVKAKIGTALLPVAVKAMHFFNDDLGPALDRIGTVLDEYLAPAIENIRKIFSGSTSGMSGDVSKNLGAIKETFASIASIIDSLWDRFGADILSYTTSTFENLRKVIGGALQVIAGIFKVISSLLKGDWKGVWDGIKQITSGALSVIRGLVSQGMNVIKTIFRLGWSAVKGIIGGVWDGIKSLVRTGAAGMVSAVRGIPGSLRALGGTFRSAGSSLIGKFFDGIVAGAKKTGGFISNLTSDLLQAVKDAINSGLNLPLKVKFNKGPIHINATVIPALAQGGVVKARPGGTLALLAEGGHDEMVTPLSGPYAPTISPRSGGTDGTANLTLNLQVDGKTLHTALLRLKRRNGNIELGLS